MKSNKKYLELVKIYHPDRNPNADQNKFKSITAAYTVLSNESTKRKYDSSRGSRTSSYSSNSSRSSSYSNRQNPYSNSSSSTWSNYGQRPGSSHSDSTNNYSRFYQSAKDQYSRDQKFRKTQQDYQKWYEDAQKRRREQEFESRQYQQGKHYYSYDDFKRDFDRQDNRTYQQNWSSDEYRKAKNRYDKEWDSIRNEYHGPSYHRMRQGFMAMYWRVLVFLIGLLFVENIIRRMKFLKREQQMMQYYVESGLENMERGKRIVIVDPSLMENHRGPEIYKEVPPRYRRPD